MYTEWGKFQCVSLEEQTLHSGGDGHFIPDADNRSCIIILVSNSVCYYCTVERKSIILVERNETRSRDGVSKINRDRRRRQKGECPRR